MEAVLGGGGAGESAHRSQPGGMATSAAVVTMMIPDHT
jgi:hypothetical protein